MPSQKEGNINSKPRNNERQSPSLLQPKGPRTEQNILLSASLDSMVSTSCCHELFQWVTKENSCPAQFRTILPTSMTESAVDLMEDCHGCDLVLCVAGSNIIF